MSVCDNPFSRFPEHYVPGLNYPNGNSTWLFSGRFDPFYLLNRQSRSVVDVTLVDYASADYEPHIHSPEELMQSTDNKSQTSSTKSSETTKIIRPRYIADELGIREKVLVAVLSETNRLNTFGLFINQTLQEHINRVLFFINEESTDFPKGMQIVAVNDKRVYLRPFYVLKYLAEKMVKLYDWFFLVPDNTFIRGFKLKELLNHISISQDLYMGQAFDDVHAVYCYYGSGILLSASVLQKILQEIDWCTNNAYSQDLTDNIGRCILKAAKLPCKNVASNFKFTAYVNYRFEFDNDIDALSKKIDFNQTLTVHPINDLETMIKLQKYFNRVEIDEMTKSISKYEETINALSCYSIEGCGNIPWPVGVPGPFKAPTRFDVLRWDFFNETHIYLKTDNDVIDVMNQDDSDDVHEVITHAVEQFKKNYGPELKFKKLINGYRQFDPTRGTHYIIDILLTDEHHGEQMRRAELMRPLGLVEIVPMPFVTEVTNLSLVLPIQSDEKSAAIRFLRHSNKTFLDKEIKDNFELLLTHVVKTKDEFSQSEKWFETLRQEVDIIRQHRTHLKVAYHTVLLHSPALTRAALAVQVLDYFQTKLKPNSLLFITSPYANIEPDFFNRCRLNVIEGIQVFFPIGFYQYHPEIIAQTYHFADNSTVELHKSHGWFNSFAFDHIGLYLSDYLALKKSALLLNNSLSALNLYDLFAQASDIHILRSPDQSLRLHYHRFKCDLLDQWNLIEYERCQKQREKGLASRSQLAMFVIENEQKMNAFAEKR